MIRTIDIKNFRCARDVKLRLSPVTALVGPNGSGKSTLLDVLTLRLKNSSSDYWRHDMRSAWFIGATKDELANQLAVMPHTANNRPWSSQLVRLNLDRMRERRNVAKETSLATDGNNLSNVIATMTRAQQSALAKRFAEIVPLYSDIDLVPSDQPGQHELRFHDRWATDVYYGANDVSDGTLLVLAFLTIQFQPAPIELLAIEEPERGLHPYLMGQVVDIFRELASSKRPTRIQVVLATHSAELLEHLEPDEVRFVSRDPVDGSTRVHEIDPNRAEWRDAFREYNESLGSAWLSGALGGVPG